MRDHGIRGRIYASPIGALAALLLGLTSLPLGLRAGQAFATGPVLPPSTSVSSHDGQHDFDFLVGSWKIHLKRRLRPLSGSNEWVEFDGTVVCRKVWSDRAELEEFDVDNPEKKIQIHGLTIRFYNPKSHQWHIYWANADQGDLSGPPVAGEFRSGRGEFYDQEEYQGRAILVRYVWSAINTDTPHFEQSYSADGGKSWETNWVTDQRRTNL